MEITGFVFTKADRILFSTKKIKNLLLAFVICLLAITGQSQVLNNQCTNIRGIAHIGYYSADYSADSVFYGNLLGLKQQKPRINSEGVVDMLKFNVNSIQSIELFKEKSADSERYYHFAILVDNSEEMRQYLKSKGVAVPETPIVNMKNYFARDFNNQICEIVDYRKYTILVSDSISADFKINTVGFIVPDLRKALDFYCDILNLSCVEKKQTSNGWFAKLNIPNTNQFIELVELTTTPDRSAEGYYNYFCLENVQLKTIKARIEDLKLPYKSDGLKKDSMTLYDYNGTRVELKK
jgi:catechol 2,3-dioxygenase-like lactoylglutathione lyase family enzyme